MDLKKLLTTLTKSCGGADFVVEEGRGNDWTYRIWKSGKVEAWGTVSASGKLSTSNAGFYGFSKDITPNNYPAREDGTPLFTANPLCYVTVANKTTATRACIVCHLKSGRGTNNFGKLQAFRGASFGTSESYQFDMYAVQV